MKIDAAVFFKNEDVFPKEWEKDIPHFGKFSFTVTEKGKDKLVAQATACKIGHIKHIKITAVKDGEGAVHVKKNHHFKSFQKKDNEASCMAEAAVRYMIDKAAEFLKK